MSSQLHDVLNCSIKVINFIKSRPLNSHLFRLLCEKMEAEHTQLLLHTEVRWLSRGRILNRLFKLRTEVGMFCKEHNSPYSELFENVGWLAKLCYLAEIFDKLDEINVGLQGKGTNILILHDKISGFLKKIDLWKKTCQKADFTCFPQLQKFIFREKAEIEMIKAMIDDHLTSLCQNFHQYFPNIIQIEKQLDWVRDPFSVPEENLAALPVNLQEILLEVSTDRGLQLKHSAVPLTEFWTFVKQEDPDLGDEALEHLLPFASTYLCEVTFSAMATIKTKQRNRLSLENSLITAVASLPPRIDRLTNK